LIDNLAFASRDKARAAAMLIDAVGEDADADGLAFDLTLNGFGGQRSLLRFAFVPPFIGITRSEEHTSELQSLMRISYAVFCLKKKTTKHENSRTTNEQN